jgi:hypothetical protein
LVNDIPAGDGKNSVSVRNIFLDVLEGSYIFLKAFEVMGRPPQTKVIENECEADTTRKNNGEHV